MAGTSLLGNAPFKSNYNSTASSSVGPGGYSASWGSSGGGGPPPPIDSMSSFFASGGGSRPFRPGLLDSDSVMQSRPYFAPPGASSAGPSSYSSHWQNYSSGPNSYGKPPRFAPPGGAYGGPPAQSGSAYGGYTASFSSYAPSQGARPSENMLWTPSVSQQQSGIQQQEPSSWRSIADLAENEGIVFMEEDDEDIVQDMGQTSGDFNPRQAAPPPPIYSSSTTSSRRQGLLGPTPMQQSFSNQLSLYTSGKTFGENENETEGDSSAPSTAEPRKRDSERAKPLLSSPPTRPEASTSPTMNPDHPAYGKDADMNYKIDGPDKFREYFDHPFSLLIFDKSYESSIWDYDPKFTWDYLPTTKRGTKLPDRGHFVYKTDYVEEEHKWKKWENILENHWQTKFVPKVKEQQAYLEAGLEPPPLKPKKAPAENKPETVLAYFEERIGFPEDSINEDYCGLCDIAFNSVLASINHYQTPKHEKSVSRYFMNSLLDYSQITAEEADKQWVDSLINRLLKRYRTKPKGYRCTICDVDLSSATMAKTHFNGQNHQRKVKGLPTVQQVNPEKRKLYQTQCVACKVHFGNQREILMHIQSKSHILNVKACAQHGVPLPPGPSSEIGKTKIAKKNMEKAQAELSGGGGGDTIPIGTGANSVPLGGGSQQELYCATCNKSLYSQKQYEMHMKSSQHMEKETNLARMAIRGRQPIRPAQKKKAGPRQKMLTVGELGLVPGGAVGMIHPGAVRIAVCKPQQTAATATITRTFSVEKSSGVPYGVGPNSRLAAAVKAIQNQQWVPGSTSSGTKF